MDLQLGGRGVLVTGGSRGIGKAVAKSFAAEGSQIAICARSAQALEGAATEIAAETGAKVLAIPADVTKREDIYRFVQTAADAFGRIDVLVNNAALVGGVPGTILDLGEDALLADLNTKLMGYYRAMQEVIPYMQRRRWGRIINIGGMAARQAGSIAGGVRNAAIANLTKNVALQVAKDGITVNVIHPGGVLTERNRSSIEERARREGRRFEEIEAEVAANVPLGRLTRPEEIASLALFLASPMAAAITGETIALDGGAFRGVSL